MPKTIARSAGTDRRWETLMDDGRIPWNEAIRLVTRYLDGHDILMPRFGHSLYYTEQVRRGGGSGGRRSGGWMDLGHPETVDRADLLAFLQERLERLTRPLPAGMGYVGLNWHGDEAAHLRASIQELAGGET